MASGKNIACVSGSRVNSTSRRRLEGHPFQVSHKQDGGSGPIFLLPQTAVLPGSDAGSDGVEPASVSSSKTV